MDVITDKRDEKIPNEGRKNEIMAWMRIYGNYQLIIRSSWDHFLVSSSKFRVTNKFPLKTETYLGENVCVPQKCPFS